MISKNTYAQNLRRFYKEHGISTTHNHAFRMAFNSRLIELGFSSADRALILGHEVQTNEAHYSLTDKRRLAGIRDRMMQKGKPLQTSLATSPEGIEPPIEP